MPPFLATPLIKYVGLPILAVLIVGVHTGAMFYFGYDYSEKATRAALAKEYEQDLADIRMRWVDDRARVVKMEERLSRDVNKVRVITKEVPKYVTPDKNEFCGPPVGIVRLLNDARRTDLPTTADQLTAEGRAPSGVDYTEQVADTLIITERYNELMIRHNELVQWVEDNYEPR